MNHPADLLASPASSPERIPGEWLSYLRENVFLYRLLPEEGRGRLLGLLPRFIAGRYWEGCAGLRVSDEMRVTIAAQACLLVLGRDGYCFDDLKTILVYPGGYLLAEEDSLGVETIRGTALGQAHHGGPVILSWWHALRDGRHPGRKNLVLHEFAHKLCEHGDRKAGIPPLDGPRDQDRWEDVFAREYQQLAEDAEYERPSLLDPYGGSSRMEFFAVASECFFLRPVEMRRRHAELYHLLSGWYRQDPAGWPLDAGVEAATAAAEEDYARHVLAECDAAIRRYPHDLEAYRRRADCYCSMGDFDKALADCDCLLHLAPEEERADAHYERGCVHLEVGAYAEAVADFGAAIRRRRDFAQAYRERGIARARQGDNERARADLNRALRLRPKDDWALLWRGWTWYATGNDDRALRDAGRAIQRCPYRAEPYHLRALVKLRQGRYAQAVTDCTRSIRLDPDCPETYDVRADAYEAAGEVGKARQDRAAALRLRE